MAFSKIVGFEVRPRRPSSRIMRSSSPLVSRPRRIWSYQMLCPSFPNSTSGLTVTTGFAAIKAPLTAATCCFLHLQHLVEPALVPRHVIEAGADESTHQLQRQ